MEVLIGQSVGDYLVLRQLSSQSGIQLYEVEHLVTRRHEAMKIMAVEGYHSCDQEGRFMREIRLQAGMRHPNIAAVFNAFWTNDALVLVSELLQGESLQTVLERGPLPLQRSLDIMAQVLSALSYSHARGVIHRDLSPANIHITPSGEVSLTDFALAKNAFDMTLSNAGSPIGSFHYMSPEQVRGDKNLDARTDVYSCGAILFELATGRKLVDGDSALTIMQAHCERLPVAPRSINPAIPPTVDAALLRAVAKDPFNRFQSAGSFRQAIEEARKGMEPAPANSGVLLRHLKVPIWAAGLALSAAVFLGAASWAALSKPLKPAYAAISLAPSVEGTKPSVNSKSDEPRSRNPAVATDSAKPRSPASVPKSPRRPPPAPATVGARESTPPTVIAATEEPAPSRQAHEENASTSAIDAETPATTSPAEAKHDTTKKNLAARTIRAVKSLNPFRKRSGEELIHTLR